MMLTRPQPIGRRIVRRMLLALLLTLHAVTLPAQTPATTDDAKAIDQALDSIEKGLTQGTTDGTLATSWMQQAGAQRDHARDCIVDTQSKLAETLQKIQTLGDALPGESADVKRARKELIAGKADAEKLLSSCQLLMLRSDDLLKKTGALQQQLLTRRLLARGSGIIPLLHENLQQAPDWIAASHAYLSTRSGVEQLGSDDALSLFGLTLLGLVVGLLLRRRLLRNRPQSATDSAPGSTLNRAAAQILARYLPALLPSLLIAAFFHAAGHTQPELPLLYLAAYGLPIYVLLLCLFRLFIVTGTTSECVALSQPIAKALMRRLALLALLLYVGYLLFATVLEQALPEPALLMLRAVFIVVFALNLVWALWLLGHVPYFNTVRWPRRSVELALLFSVVAEWLGYRNLSQATLRGLFGTLLLLGLALLLSRLLREFYDSLDIGTHRWQQGLRTALGIKPGDNVPGLAWLRPLTTLAIVSACLLGVLWTWGLSEIGFQKVHSYLLEGFKVGSLHIVPGRIAMAALILTLLLGFSGWFKGQLERNWLQGAIMERSAREALVTITGYTGTAMAVLVALGIAGMEFSNLAILAGALSVGIGFGLQNIVNNFVSGLILLFERPIKTGDWIVVGETEGYVKRISIRSTRIQTFDHADVIVPNSELISGRVTNWTLADKHGRIHVPVKVAFAGNNPEVIKRLLLDVAQAHPLVLKDPGFEPTILFLSFVDAALLFELRCFLANVNKGGQVISDLNFAIDAAFRANGVFPPGTATPAAR
jgi:potassium-dependent mechanosensitive channel